MSPYWLSLWAAPAALGFALFFNVRRRALLPIALLAIAAHLLRAVILDAGRSLTLASFMAAVLIGAVAFALGPVTGEASSVYSFAPVIPLVPGTLFFDGFGHLAVLVGLGDGAAFAQQTLTLAFQELVEASSVVLALAIGATLPGLLRIKLRGAPSH